MNRFSAKPNSSLLKLGLLISVLGLVWFGLNITEVRSASGINSQLNYQGKLADSSGVQVADASYNMKFVIYDASAGGNCLWTSVGACDTADYGTVSVTTVNGVFSVTLGDTGQNSISTSTIDWNTDSLYLGVTVGADLEMTPRKRLTSSAYSFNADEIDGLHATSTEAIANYLISLDSYGNLNLFGQGVSSTYATTTWLYVRGDAQIDGNATTTGHFAADSNFYVKDGMVSIGMEPEVFAGTATFINYKPWTANTGNLESNLFVSTFSPTADSNSVSVGIANTATGDGSAHQTYIAGYLGTANYEGTASLENLVGLQSTAELANAGSVTSTVAVGGLINNGIADTDGGGDMTNAYVFNSSFNAGTQAGTIANAYMYYSNGFTLNGGTITNAYGLKLENSNYNGGVITNLYGIYITDQAGASTNNYAIYTNSGDVRLGDDLMVIGNATTSGNLEVTGYASTTNLVLADGASNLGTYYDLYVSSGNLFFDTTQLTGSSGLSFWQYNEALEKTISPTSTDIGLYVTASSTFAANFRVDGNATTTGNLEVTGYASTTNLVLADGASNLGTYYDLYVNSGNLFFDTTQLTGSSGLSFWQYNPALEKAISPTSTDIGLYVTASSTFAGGFLINGAATTTGQFNIGSEGTGDSIIELMIAGVSKWIFGADDSDNDNFVISSGQDLGTNNIFTLGSNGAATTTGWLVIGTTNPVINMAAGDLLIGRNATTTGNMEITGYASTTNLVLADGASNLGTYYDLYVSSGNLFFDGTQLSGSSGLSFWQYNPALEKAISPTSTDIGLYVTASSTIAANFRVDGNATTTGNLEITGYASTTNLVLADGASNLGTYYDLYVSSGNLFFDTTQLTGSSGLSFWQYNPALGGAISPTSTSIGLYVTASSTIAANFRVDGNATTTGNIYLGSGNTTAINKNFIILDDGVAEDTATDASSTALIFDAQTSSLSSDVKTTIQQKASSLWSYLGFDSYYSDIAEFKDTFAILTAHSMNNQVGAVGIGLSDDSSSDYIYFDGWANYGFSGSEYFAWEDTLGGFYLSDDLIISGNATSTGNTYLGSNSDNFIWLDEGQTDMSGTAASSTAIVLDAEGITALNVDGKIYLQNKGVGDLGIPYFSLDYTYESSDHPGTINTMRDVFTAGWHDVGIGLENSSDDDAINFDEWTVRGLTAAEYLFWDDNPGQFYFSDDLIVAGNSTSTGYLVVGTTGPTVNLGAGDVWINDDLNVLDQISVNTTTPDYNLVVNSTNATDNLFQVATTTNQKIFTINSDGLVGINTTTPDSALSMIGGLKVIGGLTPETNNWAVEISEIAWDGKAGMQILSGAPTLYFRPYSGGNVQFFSDGEYGRNQSLAVIGNIGIGTTAPSYELHIVTSTPEMNATDIRGEYIDIDLTGYDDDDTYNYGEMINLTDSGYVEADGHSLTNTLYGLRLTVDHTGPTVDDGTWDPSEYNYGVHSDVGSSGSSSGDSYRYNYAFYGKADGNTNGNTYNYGGVFLAGGGDTNFGIVAATSTSFTLPTGTSYAGYFGGDVMVTGQLYASGGTVGSADYAEYFYTLDTNLIAGEVVCVDPTQENAVQRCQAPSDNNVMGIISTSPGILGNASEDKAENPHYKMVAMLGQIPVKASNENGEIRPGDSLTSASIPGYVMKANAGDSTVGVALEILKTQTGQIQMLISRRNKSLTVEQVEEKITQHIADMAIEDEVNSLIAEAVDSLNLDQEVTEIIEPKLTVLDNKIDLSSDLFNNRINSLLTQIQETAGELDLRLDGLENQVATFTDFASSTQDLLLTQGTRLDELENENLTLTEIVMANQYSLEQASTNITYLQTEIDDIYSILNSNSTTEPLVVAEPDLDIQTLVVNQAATFYGTIYVQGEAGFEHKVVFNEDIEVKGKIYASADQAGTATILAEATSTEIIFEKEYEVAPKVTLTANSDPGTRFWLAEKLPSGFRIVIAEPQTENISFDWIALGTKVALNQPPMIESMTSASDSVNLGISLGLTGYASDPDNEENELVYSWNFEPNLGHTNGEGKDIFWTVNENLNENTDVIVTLNVSDGINTVSQSKTVTVLVTPTQVAVLGCMDQTALNYNSEATEDDGSCEYEVAQNETATEEIITLGPPTLPTGQTGCTDQTALNYNPEATEDDSSCQYSEPLATEGETAPEVTVTDGPDDGIGGPE